MRNRIASSVPWLFIILPALAVVIWAAGSFNLGPAFAQAQDEPAATPAPGGAKDEPAATPAPGGAQTEVEVEKLSPEQLDDLQKRLDELKEKILKSKANLKQLLDQIRMGSVSLAPFTIQHTHEVGATFQLETLSYDLDGFQIYSGVTSDQTDLEKMDKFPIYEGSLLPGDHLLTVDMVFRGKGYGIFSYLNQYLFKVKSRYSFKVAEGDTMTLRVTSYDSGSFLTSLKDRLKVRFEKE